MRLITNDSRMKNNLSTVSWWRVLFFQTEKKQIDHIVFFNKELEYKTNNLHEFVDTIKSHGFTGIEFDENLSIKRKDLRDKPFYLMKSGENITGDLLYTLFVDMDKLGIKVVNKEEKEQFDLIITNLTLKIDGYEFTFNIGSRDNQKAIAENNLKEIEKYQQTLNDLTDLVSEIKSNVESGDHKKRIYLLSFLNIEKEIERIKMYMQ